MPNLNYLSHKVRLEVREAQRKQEQKKQEQKNTKAPKVTVFSSSKNKSTGYVANAVKFIRKVGDSLF